MPTLSVTRSYADNTVLTEQMLDDAFDSLETFVNTTKLNSANIQTGGVAESNLATGSVTENKLGAGAVTVNKIGDGAVTTAKIADANITTAKIADSNVTTAKIADANVTTAKLADGAVTVAKLSTPAVGTSATAGNIALSASSGSFSVAGTTATDVTNLSVSITTSSAGRPVELRLVADGDTLNDSRVLIVNDGGNNSVSGAIRFLRDGTTISRVAMRKLGGDFAHQLALPPSAFSHIDTSVAASTTYTYKVQLQGSSGTNYVERVKLLAREI
jgi:hypothetical protein